MAWLLVIALHASSCRDQLRSRDALRGYRYLLSGTMFSRSLTEERAAWVVRDQNGRLGFIWWRSAEDLRADYHGTIPRSAVAVAHTHPSHDPYPSPHDVAEAKRIGMPIVVVTAGALTVARPDGTVEALEKGNAWFSTR